MKNMTCFLSFPTALLTSLQLQEDLPNVLREGRVLTVTVLSFSKGLRYEGPINLMVLPVTNQSQLLSDEASTGINSLQLHVSRDDVTVKDKTFTFVASNHISNVTINASTVIAGKLLPKSISLSCI